MATPRLRTQSTPSPTGFAPKNLLLDINLDILYSIIKCMDNKTLAALSQTNHFFHNQCRKSTAFAKAIWRPLPLVDDTRTPPVFNPRGGVLIGARFYLPFMTTRPTCYVLDLVTSRWDCYNIEVENDPTYQPFVTSAVAIHGIIYMFGGRQLQTYQLSNALYTLNITSWKLRKVQDAGGSVPRPRHEHSVDVVHNRYLAIFGGLCHHSVGENDLFLYDAQHNMWLEPSITGRVPHVRFGHSSTVIGSDLYIFGGSQIENDVNVVYDDLHRLDCGSWVWHKYDPPEAYRYRRMSPPSEFLDPDVDIGSPIEPMRVQCLIPTTGQQPRERFQSGMCAVRNKLIIFGGHTIISDSDDNAEPFDYSLRALDVFCTVRNHWTKVRGRVHRTDAVCPQDMCFGVAEGIPLSLPSQRGHCIIVVGQQKVSRKSGSTGSSNRPAQLRLSESSSPPREHSGLPLSPTFANRNDANTGQNVLQKVAQSSPTFGNMRIHNTITEQDRQSPTKENFNPSIDSASSYADHGSLHKRLVSPASIPATLSTHPLVQATPFNSTVDQHRDTKQPANTPPSNRHDSIHVQFASVADGKHTAPSDTFYPAPHKAGFPSGEEVEMIAADRTGVFESPSSSQRENLSSSSTRATLNSGSTGRSTSSSGSAPDHWFCKDTRHFSLAPFRMMLVLDGDSDGERFK
ncbi:hypothetical protein BC936DRAFT_145055 [Jimgerdemannia flammicorona]|uniref:Uncharacterized protein n=1 Tax=Jimgerdemannia flammicorona TaxID=994334 RepID=A0A433DB17_9FUNG|nr:hypothetical protein BC936DRAFT_145055 [Jimgerdemannia flammicorona]